MQSPARKASVDGGAFFRRTAAMLTHFALTSAGALAYTLTEFVQRANGHTAD